MEDQINKDIKGILNKIVALKQGTYWELYCAYTDGVSTTLLSIKILSSNPKKTHGRIVFKKEDGLVHQYFYKGLPRGKKDSHITDILLEILSLEQAHQK